MIKGDWLVSAKTIYAAIYVKSYKDKIKEDLKAYFSRENIIAEKIFENIESVHMHLRGGSEENLYHLHLEVHEDESERARNLLSAWLKAHNGVQIRIAPCIEQ
ncbi:MAG: hypothetical protein K0R78_2504 [Pelosinus sp.]|jgi:hypothetical protein|nr:hypothetical protein [Pelosinus sp.]